MDRRSTNQVSKTLPGLSDTRSRQVVPQNVVPEKKCGTLAEGVQAFGEFRRIDLALKGSRVSAPHAAGLRSVVSLSRGFNIDTQALRSEFEEQLHGKERDQSTLAGH